MATSASAGGEATNYRVARVPSQSIPQAPYPRNYPYFLERAPFGVGKSRCRLMTCSGEIQQGDYRVVVKTQPAAPEDYYHIFCLETVVDFSITNLLDRLVPVTRNTYVGRGLDGDQVCEGNYLLDGGAERLVAVWMTRQLMWNCRGSDLRRGPVDPGLEHLLYWAGSAAYIDRPLPNMEPREYAILAYQLAPFESDGPGDTAEWNLFDAFLGTFEQFRREGQQSLSKILGRWQYNLYLTLPPDQLLSDAHRQDKIWLGEKAIRAIARLSDVPRPAAPPGNDIQP